jgi:serine/threonine protein kinase
MANTDPTLGAKPVPSVIAEIAGAELRLSAADLIGKSVMGYTVLRIMGRGGMGAVYEAEHRLGGRAALKVLHSDIDADPAFRQQFERETRILFKLDNTHIVKAFGYEALPDGRHCLLMAFHENRPLDAVLAASGGSLPLPTALSYGYQVLDGLEAAHQAGVWHRDLKPSNVLELNEATQVDGVTYPLLKIVDFGLAHDSLPNHRRRPSKPYLLIAPGETTEQVRAGTPAYVSPEQAGGRPTDARSDLYSFAVLLFELIAGRPPFEGPDAELLQKHLTVPPPRLGEFVEYLPEGLEELVDRFLAKDPAQRPQTATEAKRELMRMVKTLHGSRTGVTPIPRPGPTTLKLPPREPSPVTQRILDTVTQHRRVRNSIAAAIGIVLVALLFVVAGARALRARAEATAAAGSAAPSPASLLLPPIVVPVSEQEATPAELEAEDLAPVPAPDGVLPQRTHIVVQPAPRCVFDDRYRDYARRTLAELREMAKPGDAKFRLLEDRVGAGLVERDCRQVNGSLELLRRHVGAPVD